MPIRKANGVSSIGRSSGRTSKLALPLEKLVEDQGRNTGNRDCGKDQKSGENKFNGEKHAPILTGQSGDGEKPKNHQGASRNIDLLPHGVLTLGGD